MTGEAVATRADERRVFLLLVAVATDFVAIEALLMPELFSSPAYGSLRPFLMIFGGATLAVSTGAAAVALTRPTRLGAASALFLASLPAFVLSAVLLSTGALAGAWAWGVLAMVSAGHGVAVLSSRAPQWRPVPIAIGLVLVGDGTAMLVSPASFSRVAYGDLADALLPFGGLLILAGAGVLAGDALDRRRLATAAAAFALIGLGGLVDTFVSAGMWSGAVLYWVLTLFLVMTMLGEFTLRRAALVQLALISGLGAWMLASHLRGRPVTDPDALSAHAVVLMLVVGWLVAEIRPTEMWTARVLAAVAVVLAAADALGHRQTLDGAGGIASSVSSPIDTGVILAVLAAVLLARTWWPDAGVVLVAGVAASTAIVAIASVHLLVSTVTAAASLPPVLTSDLELDQACLLFGIASSVALLFWRRATSGPIQPRVYAAAVSAFTIVSISAVVSERALAALARPGDALDPQILALADRSRVMLLALLVVTMVGAAVVISGQVVRPIQRMIDVARRRAAGDRTARTELRPSDELGVLGSALDAAFAAQDEADERTDVERRRHRDVVTSALDAFVAIDPGGRIIDWNPRAQAIFGWSAEEALGQPFLLLLVERTLREQWQVMITHFLSTGVGPSDRLRFLALHRDGTSFSVEIAFSRAPDAGGGVSAFIRDISELEKQESALEHLALHDSLTGLPNRALLADRWQLAAAAAKRDGTQVALALLDLDEFKAVNDALGHAAGDQLLIEVGRRLRSAVRGTDTVGRLGGDEFAAVLTGLRSKPDAAAMGRALRATFERPVEIDGHAVSITASAGLVVSRTPEESFTEALRKADVAMYEAKNAGGDAIAAYTQAIDAETVERITLTADLRAAVAGGGLHVLYQPVIQGTSGKVLEVEALVRWDHPERGPIPPPEFVAVAERSGLISSLGSWVLQRALDDLVSWRAAGLDIGVHVNVSVRQLGDGSFVDTALQEIERRSLAPGVLTLELTESLLVRDFARIREDLVRLRTGGVRISLDDFGTGYSSLGYLHGLPLDEIKLDRVLTVGAVVDAHRFALVRAAREIARSLDLAFVAEGVEDERLWDLLASLGGVRIQGFGIASPMPAAALAGWVEKHRKRVEVRLAAQRTAAVERSLRAAERLRQGARSTRPLDDLLTNLWDELHDVIPYDRIGVALLEDDGRILRARWAKATYGEALRISHGYSSPMAGSSLEGVLRGGAPRIIGDLVAYLTQKPESMSTRLMVGEGVRSSLTCPLVVGDTAVGFMFFSSREPHTYDDTHVSAFRSLAALVSGSIAQAQEPLRLFAAT